MSTASIDTPVPAWKTVALLLFRFIFLYFVLHLLPMDLAFLRHLAAAWQEPLHYPALFNLVNYSPYSLSPPASYTAWSIIALAAIGGAAVWTILDHGRSRHYEVFHYWLRVVLRYKLAAVLLTYGFLLLFALWAPYPSLSQLNTAYGDFTLWKHFTLSIGVSPFYQSFLGFAEVGSGLLLLHRKSVPFGAFISFFILGNVFVSHVAYEGNLALYSLYLLSIAVFLLVPAVPRLVNLLILHQPTAPPLFKRVLLSRAQRWIRAVLRLSFMVFFVAVYGWSTRKAYYQHTTYRLPSTPGLPGLVGLYTVTEFHLNNKLLPYSDTDTLRWQEVVFEKWNSLSIRTYAPMRPYPDVPEGFLLIGTQSSYEAAGSTGRYYYTYAADTLQHLLTIRQSDPYRAERPFRLQYSLLPNNKIRLLGTLANKDSIVVLLEKNDKKYLLQEAEKTGRRVALKL